MAQSLLENNQRDFWSEIRRLKGTSHTLPDNIDNVNGAYYISELFLSKYDGLYNSVSYDTFKMNAVKHSLDSMISSQCASGSCTDSEHCITVAQVSENILFIKGSKHDGQTGHYSDHIINGTHKLHVNLSLLFSSMIFHGCVPDGLHLSTLIPIPKNKRKSLNDSSNCRAIALSSVLGKRLDRVILSKHYDKLATSDYQCGLKKQHSTVHCTFVVKVVI